MERIEVNCETGEVRIIQLTPEEVAAAEAQYAAWLAEQPVVADPTPVDPTPVDPAPVVADPTPVDPTPVDPTPPAPTE